MPERRVLPLHEQSQDKLAEVRISPHPSALVEDQTPFRAQGARRFTKGRDSGDALQERIDEYTAKKTDLMIAMIGRAIRKGVRFRYVLADSWFACKDVIRFIRSRHVKCDYLGMIKVGENSRTKYCLDGKPYTAPALIRHLDRQGRQKYSRRLRCYYIVADVTFADTKVRLYFVRRSKRGAWNGLMTTDIRLEFLEAYRIYAQRWSLLWKSCSRKRRGCWGWANARPATSPRKSRRHP